MENIVLSSDEVRLNKHFMEEINPIHKTNPPDKLLFICFFNIFVLILQKGDIG